MNIKTHQFLLAENPLENNQEELFIYSALTGERALLKLNMTEIEELFETPDRPNLHTICYTPFQTGVPEFHDIILFDNIDIPENKIEEILQDAGKWFKKFLLSEDEQIEQETRIKRVKSVLKDFNKENEGLKIIHHTETKQWMIIYEDIIKIFESEDDADDFLITEMNIDQEFLDKGFVNEIN